MKEKDGLPIGDIIRSHRQAAGMSQFEFAHAIGVTPGAVGQWETPTPKKNNTPQLAHIAAMAKTLNITLVEFFAGSSAWPMAADEREAQLLKNFRALENDLQKAVVTMVRAHSRK